MEEIPEAKAWIQGNETLNICLHRANCYPQVPQRPFFILFPALVLALVRYLVIVLV
jgi:hypothetical protein